MDKKTIQAQLIKDMVKDIDLGINADGCVEIRLICQDDSFLKLTSEGVKDEPIS